jgi:hypothetical protein
MNASIGQNIVIRGKTVEAPDKHCQIIEIRGVDGGPPYMVRFDDGHETLVYPGSDAVFVDPK